MKALRKVLVIDDDPVVGTSFNRVLEPKGYAVITAADGAEALERIAREDYDVVYTDIRMPGMNGLEVARRIKEARPWMPVVIVTGYGSAANIEEARKVGVSGFLNKPLSPETIEDTTASFTTEEAAVAAPLPAAPAAAPAPHARTPGQVLKNIALFIAAPFIGLAYVVIGPIVGLGMLAWFGFRALTGRGKAQEG